MTLNKSKIELKKSITLFILSSVLIVFTNNTYAQKFGNQDFYLIDSLNIDDLSVQDKLLIDTSLTRYHDIIEDTSKFEILQHIVDECWNNKVWPKYNSHLLFLLSEKLKTNCNHQERLKTLNYTAGVISNVGFLHDQKGDISSALTNYHQSLSLYEFVGDLKGSSTLFNNLGVIYSTVGDTSRALEYHNKSLLTKKKIGDLKGVAMSYNNIGTVLRVL